MNLLSLLTISVMAAESVISPLPDSGPPPAPARPSVTFGQLSDRQAVLGVTAVAPTATPAASVPPAVTRKSSYVIALVGDSMIDTLGPDCGGLASLLHSAFPATGFTVRNFGVGSTNILYGLTRLTQPYTYLGTAFPAVLDTDPDIVVIESFAYNPLPHGDSALDTQWLTLAEMADTVRTRRPGTKIIIAATIAPDADVFGDGAPGIAFAATDKKERSNVIASYLENAVRFAQSQHLPLADAYHPSLDAHGNGTLRYINPGDHIHYSTAGRTLMAQTIANTIIADDLLQ